MQIYKNGRVDDHKKMFPNISFPSQGPSDSFLAEQGAYKVNTFRSHDRATQKLVPCSPVIEDGFAYVVKVENKTEEEIAADIASLSAQIRATRNTLIQQSDWTQLADSPLSDEDKQAWTTYRQALRDISAQEGFPSEITWPTRPGEESVPE